MGTLSGVAEFTREKGMDPWQRTAPFFGVAMFTQTSVGAKLTSVQRFETALLQLIIK